MITWFKKESKNEFIVFEKSGGFGISLHLTLFTKNSYSIVLIPCIQFYGSHVSNIKIKGLAIEFLVFAMTISYSK